MEVPTSIWKSSGNFWTELWSYVYGKFQDDFFLITFGSFGVTATFFIVLGFFFTLVDIWGPSILTQYKVQESKNVPISYADLIKLVKLDFINLMIISPCFSYLGSHLLIWRGMQVLPEELPTFQRFVINTILLLVLQDFLFYYLHRLFHYPPLYRAWHKKHHEFTAPVAIASVYAHPVEHVFVNLLSVWLPILIVGVHCAEYWLWFGIVITGTFINHSGYHLPFVPISPEHHDFHHLVFTENFGTFRYLDWLNGTDKQWQASQQRKRDYTLTSFTPVKCKS
eukprot:TRINITY_DN9082_c0_g1_i1.p1 TRINITY_DN9082_c0_g1~~TRINITY_DN9082_c0_g1_i1.p1  ORF type:complete len:281 (-),score=35.50 TRINITY_DN9082_c0_g1_i1:212-1054(-)